MHSSLVLINQIHESDEVFLSVQHCVCYRWLVHAACTIDCFQCVFCCIRPFMILVVGIREKSVKLLFHYFFACEKGREGGVLLIFTLCGVVSPNLFLGKCATSTFA